MINDAKTFTEVGLDFDNNKFGLGVSTEIENSNGEIRQKGFKKMKIKEVYLRIWALKRVLILSSRDGFKIVEKDRNNFKVVLGISDR